MEQKNLDKALDIVSKLIVGEEVSRSTNISLYEEYNGNSEVNDMVHDIMKKFNLCIYEYKDAVYVSAGENNRVFGYTNEELKKTIGVKLNKELFLSYFIIYNVITQFYNDSASYNYIEFIRIEDTIKSVDDSILTVLNPQEGIILDEVEENSFKSVALVWDELQAVSVEDGANRAARNSKAGFVKMVFNFMVGQELLMEAGGRYYPTDRFRALIENYFDEFKGRLYEIMNENERKVSTNAAD